MTNIIVTVSNKEAGRNIKNLLVRNGYTHTYLCATGAQALSQADAFTDGIILCSYKLTDMIYTELYGYMPRDFEMILLASSDMLAECAGNDIICLPMPIKVYDLLNTVEMLSQNMARKRKRRKEQPRRRSERETELVQEAKLVLMRRNQMTEEEAHRYIQKCSMDSATNMVETAQMILTMMQ